MWLTIRILMFSLATAMGSFSIPGERHPSYFQPEQIHLAYGKNHNEMVVTWSTLSAVPSPSVLYGKTDAFDKVSGYSKKFVDGGKKKRSQYIHRVTLTGLESATKYVYRCGGDLGWSEQFWFRSANESSHWSPVVAAFGDMGNENARSLPMLQLLAQDGKIDVVLHIGDMAYDMKTDEGRFGDEFMRQIQPIAAYVPYMVCPGNHEQHYNFSHFRERFTMPGDYESLFYSFNLGPVHFVSIDTEVYYYTNYGVKILVNQYNWVVQDLKEANSPENRMERPWIVTYGHKPMYCSNQHTEDCNLNTTRVRVGMPGFEWFGLENVFYDAGVDLELWGHEHSYERLFPIYNYEMKNGSLKAPYYNPKAPIHITTGSAGCNENHAIFPKNVHPWSAFRSLDYGFSLIHFLNNSHTHVQQISINQGGKVIDDIWIVKDDHQSYKFHNN